MDRFFFGGVGGRGGVRWMEVECLGGVNGRNGREINSITESEIT